MMVAAWNDHHAIVERLVVARADLSTKNAKNIFGNGCALPRSPSGGVCRSPTLCRLRLAPSGRDTALHLAAYGGCTKSAVALLVGGADQTITNKNG